MDEVGDDAKDCVDEAAGEGEEAIDELEDEEVVDEDKVVDAAAEGYAGQLGVTVTVTVLMLTEHTLMILGRSALLETRVERVERPMAKE